jgi:hypothetical protein
LLLHRFDSQGGIDDRWAVVRRLTKAGHLLSDIIADTSSNSAVLATGFFRVQQPSCAHTGVSPSGFVRAATLIEFPRGADPPLRPVLG